MVFSIQLAMGQGSTTSSMNGTITDSNGEPVPGATVIAVHTPTNSQFGNTTDVTGTYRLNNLNVGGPYTVTISFRWIRNLYPLWNLPGFRPDFQS